MASLEKLEEGTVFATDYRVVRPLSEGGMGAVYVVEQISTGKQRALKVMHPNLVHDSRQRQRFVQEAKIGARIESDHVVEVLGAGVEPSTGTPWLAMELLNGETLDQRIERAGPLSRSDVAEIFRQLCHALGAAHDVGIVHRDLKPENIFLAVPRREGVPFTLKILDFGIAKLVAESGNTTQAIGSPLWMAPEQTNVEAPITPSTDVWALGLIAFTCFTGHSYWRGAHAEVPNPMSLVMEICFDPLPPASERAKEFGVERSLPPGFDEWFAQCVSRETDKRFKNARSARTALERMLSSEASISAATPSIAPASLPLEAPDLDLPKPQPKPEQQPKPEPPKPSPEPESRAVPSRPTAPQPVVIPPIRPSRSASSRIAVGVVPRAREGRPFPWAKAGVAAMAVVAGLFVAQRFFWTRASNAPSPSAAPSQETKPATAPSGTSSAATSATCRPGMVRIPAGELVAGDPTKAVDAFCLDVHETSVKEYAACVKAKKCTPAATIGNWTATTPEEKAQRNQACNFGRADRGDHPINCVDLLQAEAYCAAQGKRLPTETEWQWAARSGVLRWKYPWGAEPPDVQLCWSGIKPRSSTCPVGSYSKGKSAQGVQDLAGNVREWTSTTVSGDAMHCGSDWTDRRADDLYKLGYCAQAPKTSKGAFLGFRCAE